jgi:predicted Zn finger-like uncharacterized protein
MALATRCPHCNALFRVAADQLKLRGGLVRCGECGQVFDGLATLSYVDDAVLSAPATSPAAVGAVIAAIRKAEAVAAPALSPHEEESVARDLAVASTTPDSADGPRGAREAMTAEAALGAAALRPAHDAGTAAAIADAAFPAAEGDARASVSADRQASAEPATPTAAELAGPAAPGPHGSHRDTTTAPTERAGEADGAGALVPGATLPPTGQADQAATEEGEPVDSTLPAAESESPAPARERPANALATATAEETSASLQSSSEAGQTTLPAEAAQPGAATAAGEEGAQTTAAATTAADAPTAAFLQEQAVRKSRLPRPLLLAAVAVLALLLLAQLAVAFRAEILVHFPQSRPTLEQLCRVFRCTVDWPMRRELLAVVGTELQALPGADTYELTAVVRNRGQITVALPAIELTLTDTLNRIVARKVFTPADYLGADRDAETQRQAGMAAGADLTIRVAFEARAVNAAGFVVYPFYL